VASVCFLWHIGKAADTDTPVSMLCGFRQEFFRDGLSFGRVEEFAGFMFAFFVLTLIPAAAIAWVIHCPIVMLMSARKKAPSADH
jgi:hypothetical protein